MAFFGGLFSVSFISILAFGVLSISCGKKEILIVADGQRVETPKSASPESEPAESNAGDEDGVDGFAADEAYPASLNGLTSKPCIDQEMGTDPGSICLQAQIQSPEETPELENALTQHRSIGLFTSTGKFVFRLNAMVDALDSNGATKRVPRKIVKYLGTCRNIGSAKQFTLTILSVTKFDASGNFLKQYGNPPGAIPALAAEANTVEGAVLRGICSEIRKGTRPHPEIVF